MNPAREFVLDHPTVSVGLLFVGLWMLFAACVAARTKERWLSAAVAATFCGLGMLPAFGNVMGIKAATLAETLPADHPGLEQYAIARRANSVDKLHAFVQAYSNPVAGDRLLVLRAALNQGPDHSRFNLARRELASGYVSTSRYDEIVDELLRVQKHHQRVVALSEKGPLWRDRNARPHEEPRRHEPGRMG